MLHSFLDHMVITAPSLEAGSQYVRQHLGVPMEAGGKHLRMGTHNVLLKLGKDQYLEVIAIDPDAPAPLRPRWFGLDHPEASLAPRLAGWVTRIGDIQTASTALSHAFGRVEEMSRGDLEWRITIPEDGSLPCEGVAPMMIQWTAGSSPANRLRNQGCSLLLLEGFHPQAERITCLLQIIGFKDSFVVSRLEAPGLVAHIQTPNGVRRIGTVAK
jgi:hypothetical protein